MAKKRIKPLARKAKSQSRHRLKDILKGISKKNRHPEIDFGPPVGREML